jgi:large subunit ribosomal protein L24
MEKPIPYSSLRLSITLRDHKTGISSNFTCEKVHVDGGRRWVFAPDGTQIILPGSITLREKRLKGASPSKTAAEKAAARANNKASDTLRMEVEEKTFVPSLLSPPMPGSVIDELRNKYSIFRTRHDPEYISAKMAEDEAAEAKKALSKTMRTPLGEINRLERKLRRAKGKGKLTDQMLERIGAVIASKKQLQLPEGVQKEVLA